MKGSYVRITAGFFFTTLAKINTVTGIFQEFYLDLKQDFPIADSVNFKFSVTKQTFSCSDLT